MLAINFINRTTFNRKVQIKERSVFLLFCFVFALIMIVEMTMSYYFPIAAENVIQSNFLTGSIIGLCNFAALACDLTFPQLFKKRGWKFLLLGGIIVQIGFPGLTHLGIIFHLPIFFILAALFWNTYYELISFSRNHFIATNEAKEDYSKDWGTISIIIYIAAVVGPILGSQLLKTNILNSAVIFSVLELIAFLFVLLLILIAPNHKKEIEPIHHHVSNHMIHILKEFSFWEAISLRIFPVILMGTTLSFIEGGVLTAGGLLGEKFLGAYNLDWLVIFAFNLPGIIGSLLLTKIRIVTRKKKYSQIAFLLCSVPLMSVSLFSKTPLFIILMFLIAGLFVSIAWILNQATFSDLTKRSGKSKMHLASMERLNDSIGYLLGPIMIGFLSDKTDYLRAFSIVGGICFVVALLLILITPRKLRLPQVQLEQLEKSLRT